MNMQEMTRFILALRDIGFTEAEINNFILYLESGNLEYKPTRRLAPPA